METDGRLCHIRRMRLITEQPNGSRLGDFLKKGLGSDALSFRGAAAFIRASGMAHLQPLIREFSTTRPFEMIVGVDLKGSTVEGLRMLLDSLGEHGQAFVYHNNGPSTFHPKLFRFGYGDRTELYVGSGNLTAGGLFTNHEAGLQLTIGPSTPGGTELMQELEQALDRWSLNGGPAALALNADLIAGLAARRLILSEAAARASVASKMAKTSEVDGPAPTPLFGSVGVPAAPAPMVDWAASISADASPPQIVVPPQAPAPAPAEPAAPLAAAPAAVPEIGAGAVPRYFVMTLLKTDMGRGQTTKGTASRSPEVFIPLAARNLHPAFWKWPHSFVEDPALEGKFDRVGVPFVVNGHPAAVNMMTWPVKHDFRLRSEALRSGGNIGDILLLERSDAPGLEYIATFVTAGTSHHAELLQACDKLVRSSTRRFGYF